MPNITLSGYLAAAQTVTFSGTQTLNSLLDNEWTNWSDEIDNSTNKYPLADLEIVLGSAAFTGADAGIEIYIIPTVDGTNYPDWTGDSTADQSGQVQYFVSFLPVTPTTSAKRVASWPMLPVQLPNGKFRFGVRNRANVTLASSGNTLSWRPHTRSV